MRFSVDRQRRSRRCGTGSKPLGSPSAAPKPCVARVACPLSRLRWEQVQHIGGNLPMDPIARLFICAGCGKLRVICPRCDRGNRYCCRDCAAVARQRARLRCVAASSGAESSRRDHFDRIPLHAVRADSRSRQIHLRRLSPNIPQANDFNAFVSALMRRSRWPQAYVTSEHCHVALRAT